MTTTKGLLVPLEGEIRLVDIPLHPTEGYAMFSEVMMGLWTLASMGQGWIAYRRTQGFRDINHRATKIAHHPSDLRGDVIFYGGRTWEGHLRDLPEHLTSYAT